jgi:ribosomal protein L29
MPLKEENMRSGTLRAELDELRAELARLRVSQNGSPPAEQSSVSTVEAQIAELHRLVHQMLEEAEDTVAEHPVAAIAGALALGIVIGRLTR